MNTCGTIAAISSAVGAAARMIVRMSGGDAISIARAIAVRLPADPVTAGRCELHFADLVVPTWVYFFAEGRSYTGESLVEFHIPGNALLARMLLEAVVARGARHAEPGEFTARAYFSGRIDLTEVEGVAATIGAHGEQELRAARQLLAGELSRRLAPHMDALAHTLALVEAGIDFADEGISFVATDEIECRAAAVNAALRELVENSARFEPLRHEPTFVLVGRPNAGKSTLLNALAGRERAVVSPVAGTTRDALSAEVRLRRGLVRMIDVAGLEPAEPADADAPAVTPSAQADISRQMQEQARRALETADRIVLVRELTDLTSDPLEVTRRPIDLVVLTKLDLAPDEDAHGFRVSALTGEGMRELLEQLDRLAFGSAAATAAAPAAAGSATLALNARHRHAIDEAREALGRARSLARGGGGGGGPGGGELIALELREALDALGRVLGRVTPDDVLGRIFATFCIGK